MFLNSWFVCGHRCTLTHPPAPYQDRLNNNPTTGWRISEMPAAHGRMFRRSLRADLRDNVPWNAVDKRAIGRAALRIQAAYNHVFGGEGESE